MLGFIGRPRDPVLPTRSVLPAPTKPLFKPEPGLLLDSGGLKLSPDQRRAVTRVAAGWAKEKSQLLQAMDGFAPKPGRVDQIASGLADYSDLSRAYDVARSQAWAKALKALTDAQRREVAR